MEMMKRAVITGEKNMELTELPIPEPREDWVLVKVRAIPLCTEYKGWLNGSGYSGHEAAGEVVKVPEERTDSKVKVGDRVAVMPGWPCGKCALCLSGEYIHCQDWYDYRAYTGLDTGGDTHVQYLVKQDWLLAPIPDGVSYELGAMACCGLGPTFGALDRLNAKAFDTVLITGAGPVGMGGIVNAKYRGAKVISVDCESYRLNKAKELGADLVIDCNASDVLEQIMAFTNGKGADIALETSGTNDGTRTCLDGVRRHGSIALIGENGEMPIHISNDFIRKGITMIGQWHYNRNLIPDIMKVIKNSPVIDKMITHQFPMTQINEALEISSKHECGKIMIDPWK